MSYHRINNPQKRNEEVEKYLELKDILRNRDREEKMGELGRGEELAKIFKPVTAATTQLEKKVTEKLGEIPESIKELDTTSDLYFPDDPELTQLLKNLKSSRLLSFNKKIKDGISLSLGGNPLQIYKNYITFYGNTYPRTPELMDLILSIQPKEESLNNTQAINNYAEILKNSDVLTNFNKNGELVPNRRLTNTNKWKTIWVHIYRDIKDKQEGRGLKQNTKTNTNKKAVFLSSDPEALADRLALLCGSAQAGNTGLRNEMVEICNELIRQKIMTRKQRDTILNDI